MEKKGKKNKILKKILCVLLILILLGCLAYIVIDIVRIYKTKKSNDKMQNLLESIEVNPTDTKTEMMLKLEELQKINSDIVAWIKIEGSNINYPVLQTTDNSFYMKHTYNKEYSSDGSLFLDKDYDWNLPSSNLLIYGHNNKNGTMFQELLKYKDESYYNEHPTIKFTTNGDDAEFEIIATFYSQVYYKSNTNVFRYYYFINAETEAEFNDYVSSSKKASIYDTGKTAKYGDQLMTLSTCSYHTEDRKICSCCKKN